MTKLRKVRAQCTAAPCRWPGRARRRRTSSTSPAFRGARIELRRLDCYHPRHDTCTHDETGCSRPGELRAGSRRYISRPEHATVAVAHLVADDGLDDGVGALAGALGARLLGDDELDALHAQGGRYVKSVVKIPLKFHLLELMTSRVCHELYTIREHRRHHQQEPRKWRLQDENSAHLTLGALGPELALGGLRLGAPDAVISTLVAPLARCRTPQKLSGTRIEMNADFMPPHQVRRVSPPARTSLARASEARTTARHTACRGGVEGSMSTKEQERNARKFQEMGAPASACAAKLKTTIAARTMARKSAERRAMVVCRGGGCG